MTPMERDATVPQQSPADAQARLASATPPTLLDVREPYEYESAHLANAILCPMSALSPKVLGELLPQRDAPVLVYCRSGHRSDVAAHWMQREGYTNVANLAGGILAWMRIGAPVER